MKTNLITIDMKKIVLAAMAAAALASCARVSDVTRISGKITSAGIDEVNVIIPDLQIDTLVPVTDGKFYVEVPADATVLGSVSAANFGVEFVPDGTALSVTLDQESAVTSKAGSASVQERMNEYRVRNAQIMNDYQARVEQIIADTLAEDVKAQKMEECYNNALDEYLDYNNEILEANKDNILALFALQNVGRDMSDSRLDSLLGTFSARLQENAFVQSLRKSIQVRENTAEGKMFTDFTIEDSDGKTVSLSDYVGKGKYVLVDFWASWCGPCKREIPNLKEVYAKYRSKGLEMLSVAVWDEPQATKDTARAYGVNWKQIINAQRVPTDIYGIEGIPHIILFGPDGTILKRDLRGEAIDEEIAKHIK